MRKNDPNIIADMEQNGVITYRELMTDLNVSKPTAIKKLKEIDLEYPGKVTQLNHIAIGNGLYGQRKSIMGLSSTTYHQWLLKQNPQPISILGITDAELIKQLNQKSKDELVMDLVNLRHTLLQSLTSIQ